MSEKEKKALEAIWGSLNKMSDFQKGRLVGYAERMEEESKAPQKDQDPETEKKED